MYRSGLLPLLTGVIVDRYGVHTSFIVTVASYIYIVFYGIRGYKPKNIS
jgi:FHS family L-fucose permease-like MFS transporter